nr:hypothetical protein [Lachnospiraceae bacterium]
MEKKAKTVKAKPAKVKAPGSKKGVGKTLGVKILAPIIIITILLIFSAAATLTLRGSVERELAQLEDNTVKTMLYANDARYYTMKIAEEFTFMALTSKDKLGEAESDRQEVLTSLQ